MRPSPKFLLFAVAALFLASCSKEDIACPRTEDEPSTTSGVAKNHGVPTVVDGSSSAPQAGAASTPSTSTGNAGGISDDGDDISDSEKSRKKRH
ncbi:MAG: hypothetical protein IT225_04410 [Flavobacteriales bacterium]|jgi:hypothetical protein|nr:hypothetical protein [Flavobacteriales bacterium]